MIRLPRWVHRLYAWALRYFWLPCPRCGVEFGGHEVVDPPLPTVMRPASLAVTKTWILCPACTRNGAAL